MSQKRQIQIIGININSKIAACFEYVHMLRSGWKSLRSNECAIENISGCGWTEKLSKLPEQFIN